MKRITTPTPPLVTPSEIALSDTVKAEAIAESLEAHFQPVADPSDPAVIETVHVALRAYFYETTREHMLVEPAEVQHAIRSLKISKATSSDGIPNRALKHLSQRMILLLVVFFNAILRTQYFPPLRKYARVIYILKPGKDRALHFSYRPISLLDTIGNVFEKILLSKFLSEVSESGLLHHEPFGFRPKQSTSLQLARLI